MVPLIAYTWNMFNIGKVSVVKAHRAMLFYLFIIIIIFLYHIIIFLMIMMITEKHLHRLFVKL